MDISTAIILMLIFNLGDGKDCTWNRDTDFSEFPPLVMDKANMKSILPIKKGAIRDFRIKEGATVIVSCPKTTITSFPSKEGVTGICQGGNVLKVGGKNYKMSLLGCSERVKERINKMGSCESSIGSKFKLNAIGYEVPGYGFYELIRICFDHSLETPSFSSHLLRGRGVKASDGNPTRPNFRTSGFFTIRPDDCYNKDSQVQLMEDILGDGRIIDSSNSNYLARGHLSPDADFSTEMEADATYYYINVVPQWQSINNGNWKFVESAVRNLASLNGGRDFQIWTGPWGILSLDDVNNNPQEIYLGLTQKKKVIPVPAVIWKVIYEESTNRGVAIISSNNPYLTSFPTTLCPDICNSLPWISFEVTDLAHGATYCCTVQTFHKAVSTSPHLGNARLLDS